METETTNHESRVAGHSSRPVASGEEWLGRNTSSKRRLWEQLNPRHRKTLLLMARALALRQGKAHLPEPIRVRLLTTLDEIERLVARLAQLLATVHAPKLPPH